MNVIKTLAKSIKEYKKQSIITPLLMIVEVSMECIVPLIMVRLIDSMEAMQNVSEVLIYGAILTVLTIISLASGMIAARTCAKAGAGFAKNLRNDMYARVQKFAFGDVDKFSTSSLITRMTTDVVNVQNAYQMVIRTAVRTPLMVIFSLAMAFSINVKISLIFLIIVPLFALGLLFIVFKVHPIFMRIFKVYDAMNNSIEENVAGIRVVKSFAREDYEQQKFFATSERVRADFTHAEKIIAFFTPLMQLVVFGTMLLIVVFGANTIVGTGSTELTTGGLGSLITYALQILSSLMMMSLCVVFVVIAQESGIRIAEVLNADSSLVDPEDPVTEIVNADVRFENVTFKYSPTQERASLENVDLYIREGEFVGVIGGTGSGKTSLVQLIPRLYDVSEGKVTIGGRDVREYSLATLRDNVSMVLQKNLLFSGTIAENLRWGNENASDEEVVAAAKTACADEFIRARENGYDTFIEQGGVNVSGGQKQRLCIARALLKKPRILIMDDSTSAVDTKTDAAIRKALKEQLTDMTKIIIAQRVASVMDADKIVIMDGGKIIATGKHDQLLETCDVYRELYESQTKTVTEAAQ